MTETERHALHLVIALVLHLYSQQYSESDGWMYGSYYNATHEHAPYTQKQYLALVEALAAIQTAGPSAPPPGSASDSSGVRTRPSSS
jgi:hypothetical protein